MINHVSIPQYLLESSFCLVLFYLFYITFLKKETYFQLNRAYLILTALLSIVIPIININFNQASHISGAEKVYPIIDSVNTFQLGIHQTITQQSNVLQISVSDIITYIYMAGFFVMTLKLMSGLFKLFGIINRSPKMKDTDHTLLISTDVPASSFFSYIFWNDKHDKSDDVQNTIMDHEMVHVRQWHSLDVIVMELMVIIKWFNPLIYLFRNSLKQTHEFIADKYVTEKMVDKVTYASILLTNKARTDLPPATNHFYGHIKERVKMLSTKRSAWSSRFRYLAAIPIGLVLFSLFSFDLSKKLPENIKNPFQSIETTMLATADQKVISLNMDEETEREKFYLTWGESMNIILTQQYKTQDIILQYKRSDLNKLLSEDPSIIQDGKNLKVEIDTLEILKDNKKMAIDLSQLSTYEMRKKFIDSLNINDQILVSLKSFSSTDSLRINLHLSIDQDSENYWSYKTDKLHEVIKWGDVKITFEEMFYKNGVRLDLDNIVTSEQLHDMLDQEIKLSTDGKRYSSIESNRTISFKYMRANNSKLASVNLAELSKTTNEKKLNKDMVFLSTNYHGKDYQIYENSWEMDIQQFYNQKEEFKNWLSNAKNGDNISITISDNGSGTNGYKFNLRYRDYNEAISAPFPIALPYSNDFFSNFQIVSLDQTKSLVRVDTKSVDGRRIADAYKGSSSYEIVHIDNFKTKNRVYESNLPDGKLVIADILERNIEEIDIFRINEHYTSDDQLIRLDWGKMVSLPNIGNYSLKEFKRSSKGDLELFCGTKHLEMERYDLLIVPENGKIIRIRTDKVNTQQIRKILDQVNVKTSIYVDNIIVSIDGKRNHYPYNFVFTVE